MEKTKKQKADELVESLNIKDNPWSKASKDNIPVEEEPTQEIKAGDEVEYKGDKSYQLICNDMRGVSWILKNGQGFGQLVLTKDLKKVQPQKTQEEMDREKAEELLSTQFISNKDSYKEMMINSLLKMADYGRNTKQN